MAYTDTAPTGAEVVTWLGLTGQGHTARAEAMIPEVTAFARAYTRGRGFGPNGTMAAEISAVILTVTARAMTNPDGLGKTTITGPFTETMAGWQGFNLMERLTLDRYRVKAL